ncbi:hypothetical protein E5676_scaffold14G00230 [Cucumis melo var. makuwa]|uniref:Uncharacterized protein n=1 Tax=Cucumis melo var. makuwa TaxID=1194695 RepID=A0A5A7VG06_CUCMM|nr:hypothetical protein E6C27_scaffold38G00590 [Cucumis melo var. makuwa]TYK26259.1 hypothetical protein E5676_scaffold14G00230 [Cucumis melo var. makuwa]
MKTGEKGLLKFLHPKLRNLLHPINIEAVALWSVAGTATAFGLYRYSSLASPTLFFSSTSMFLFVVKNRNYSYRLETEKTWQPFDWLKKKVWKVEEKEENEVQTNE